MIEEIGIIDARKIINVIKENYNIDFSNYALTSLKRRFLFAWQNSGAKSVDDLLIKLSSRTFFESFLYNICVDVTEMFRDPGVWRELKSIILSNLEGSTFKIWFPNCSSGEELYSIAIMLREMGVEDKVQIYATNQSCKKNEFVQAGVYAVKREDVNSANYERTHGEKELSEYLDEKNNKIQMDTTLLKNVEFICAKSIQEKAPKGVKLIIYRNSLIYFNKSLQNEVIDTFYDALLPNGYLCIGIKESLNSIGADKKFRTVNEVERIFQKLG